MVSNPKALPVKPINFENCKNLAYAGIMLNAFRYLAIIPHMLCSSWYNWLKPRPSLDKPTQLLITII